MTLAAVHNVTPKWIPHAAMFLQEQPITSRQNRHDDGKRMKNKNRLKELQRGNARARVQQRPVLGESVLGAGVRRQGIIGAPERPGRSQWRHRCICSIGRLPHRARV